ncbi:MAG: hypothetical protein HYS44_03740 [Candidatus Niyogibacteria bacterium]|nr:hypothetical protein [Candidatus Niyogibacteria bacterium]
MERVSLRGGAMWQDYMFMIGQWIMTASLFPTLFAREKPSLWTSIPTGIFCLLFGFTFYTLSFPWSTASASAAGVLWLILAVQKYRNLGTQKRPV